MTSSITPANAREKELHKHGLSTRQAAGLLVLKASGGSISMSSLPRWTIRKPHTISGILSRMEKMGLIERVLENGEKRHYRVVLTEKGYEAYEKAAIRESVHRIMSNLSIRELDQLSAVLNKLRAIGLSTNEGEILPVYPPAPGTQ